MSRQPPEAVTKTPDDKPGSTLIAMLWERMKAREETTHDLAAALGMTYAYLMALARGDRRVPTMDSKHLRNAAQYLEVPVAQVYLLAEILAPEDFFVAMSAEGEMLAVRKAIQGHPAWCGLAPSEKEWNALPPRTRTLIALLFERTTSQSLLEKMEIPTGIEQHPPKAGKTKR